MAKTPLCLPINLNMRRAWICTAAPTDGAPIVVPAGEVRLIPCGFSLAVPESYEAQIRPRSGLSTKHRISMPNAPGTIDADYRGEVMVPLINHGECRVHGGAGHAHCTNAHFARAACGME